MSTPRPGRIRALLLSAAVAVGGCAVVATAQASTADASKAPWSLRLFAGTHPVRDSSHALWSSDKPYVRGGRLVGTREHIAGTDSQQLYRSARRGPFDYHLHVQPGTYQVTVNLAEYTYRAAGKRTFAVIADGRIAARIDAARSVGRLHADHVRFRATAPSGALVLRFAARPGIPLVSSVSVTRIGGPIRPKPAPKPTTPRPTTAITGSASGTPAPAYVTPEMFGATGDGVADDTTALQRAFDSASATVGVRLAPGKVYAHAKVLDIRVAGERVTGGGTLLATNEQASSVWADADNVVIDDVTVAIAKTTRRGETWDQMGVRIVGHSGVVLRSITVNGSAAAGIYVGNSATNFVLDHVTVRNTRADGIHVTEGANNGRIIAPTVIGSGDDGVAIVSYGQDGAPCHDITVASPVVRDQTWGRGLSVVGGTNITETNINVHNSNAAAVYIGVEGDPWNTAPATNVTFSGGTITGANTNANLDHGAVFVIAGRSGYVSRNITVSGLTITDTRFGASRDLGVVTYGSSPPANVLFANLTIIGGPHDAYSGNTAQSSYRLRNITQNGVRLLDEG